MSDDSAPCLNKTPASESAAESSAVRSGIYAVLAQGFSQPNKKVVEFLRQCRSEIASGEPAPSELRALLEAVDATTLEELSRTYIKLFDPVSGPFPYEAELNKPHDDFSKAHVLADVNGFYRAFGVEPSCERPDHIAAELDFMYYLALKEAHALRAGQADNASLCRDAQQKFFGEHLSTWTDTLLETMRARGGGKLPPFYAHLTGLLQVFMERERKELA